MNYTDFFISEVNPLAGFFEGKADIEKTMAFLHYEKGGNVQKLIFSIKYYGNKKLAHLLGRMAARELKPCMENWPAVDFLVPVPLHPKRLRERGYNQSEWICLGLASVLNIPVNTKSLLRNKYTKTQTRKDMEERSLNVRGAFVINDTETLQGRHVLLVDDVLTSGSTILACAEALLTIPNIRVSVLAIAKA
ncbi:MAG: ComF family protein [Tannerellaceae bacterium]|nr:ComF family protein [Tannerellaceae bacterium]